MMERQEELLRLLMEQDEVSWQTLVHEIVHSEDMNPWDIDVSKLTLRYIDMIKQLKEYDFRISGKVLLAAAVLLHIKSKRLVSEDIAAFDSLANPSADDITEGEPSDFDDIPKDSIPLNSMRLVPRTPQPRRRKVSVYDLIDALQQALEIKKRRVLREMDVPEMIVPEKKVDITKLILDIYKNIKDVAGDKGRITFEQLVNSDKKEDKVYTFIPLLHLSNQRKIDLAQEKTFGDIMISLANR